METPALAAAATTTSTSKPFCVTAPEHEAQSKEEAELCVVCLEGKQTHAMIPCGHQCVCGPCSGRIVHPSASREPACPLCREPAMMAVCIYKPG